MRAYKIAAAVALASTLLCAEDFSLTHNGFGSITVHSQLTYESKGERLVATATNDSGQTIPYAKLCVKAETKGCLFELWTTRQWEPGTTLNFNVTSARRVPNLAYEVTIEALNLPKAAPQAAAQTSTRASPPSAPPIHSRPATDKPAPETLTNETVIKLVKAGLGDDVIVGMIANQPGRYAQGSADIITMKEAGASDKVIAAILNSKGPSADTELPGQLHIEEHANFSSRRWSPISMSLLQPRSSNSTFRWRSYSKKGTPTTS